MALNNELWLVATFDGRPRRKESATLSVLRPKKLVSTMLVLAALVSVAMLSGEPAVAHAEGPLYCSGEYYINEGCNGPDEVLHVQEDRNEDGGCIAGQWYFIEGGGYSAVKERCSGQVLVYYIEDPPEWYSFPRCWNRTNAKNLIHCRRED